MHVEERHESGLLRIAPTDRALVAQPDWEPTLRLRRPDTALVALDLEQVDFISSLFLQGCVELGRKLAVHAQELVLLHLSPHQEQLLELVEGPIRLSVVHDEGELEGRLAEARARLAGAGGDGVSRNEKLMLWG
jgi:hypothetical protein